MFSPSARVIIAALALLATGCRRSTSAAPPLVRITSHDFNYEMPRRVPAGLIHFRLVNQGPDIHEATIVRFSGSGSAAGYVDSVRAHVDFPAFATDMGGPDLASEGDSTEIYLSLEPGHYAVVCWKDDHLRRGMAHDFTVIADSTSSAQPPREDLTITMMEYAFQLSGPIVAGAHLIRIKNAGVQPHEMDLFRLAPGTTVQDYIAWSAAGERGHAPAEPAGGAADFVGGLTVWLPLTLRPGRYFMICHVPDAVDGKPHYARGMFREFEVK